MLNVGTERISWSWRSCEVEHAGFRVRSSLNYTGVSYPRPSILSHSLYQNCWIMPDKRTTLVGRHYATKSRRSVPIKTPGGKLVSKVIKKKTKGVKCSDCKALLPGIKTMTLSAFKNSKKRQRTVSRAYGGAVCASCVKMRIMRAFLLEEQKAVKALMAARK